MSEQTKHDDGPAFPAPMIPCDNQGGYTEVRHTGMSLRDYFAAKAMQAMIGNLYESHQRQPEAKPGGIVTTTLVMPDDSLCAEERPDEDNGVGTMDDAVAISAYRIADAMLRARKK